MAQQRRPDSLALARTLTIDAGLACPHAGSELVQCADVLPHRSAAASPRAAGPSGAPAPPASPFSTVPSEIVSAFDCLKAPAECGGAPVPPPACVHACSGASSSCSAAVGHGPAVSEPTLPLPHDAGIACGQAGCGLASQKSADCLSTALSGLDSQVQPSLLLASSQSVCGPLGGNCPAHGVKAVCGKRNKMEDTFAVQTNFFEIPPFSPTTTEDTADKLPARIALQLETEAPPSVGSLPISPSTGQPPSDTSSDPSTACCSCTSSEGGIGDTLHFFGVYDGHGGCQAAEHCARRLHHHLSEALANVCSFLVPDGNQEGVDETDGCQAEWTTLPSAEARAVAGSDGLQLVPSSGANLDSHDYHELLTKNSAEHSDDAEQEPGPGAQEADVESSVSSGSSSSSERSEAAVSLSHMLEDALKNAFLNTDAEFANDGCAAMVGSTALVALVGSKKIWMANCGDSRAVLCRAGKAIQLTDDHKPEREDEAERVEKAGGQVLYWNGHRVMGVLAMSRAIGDHGLRPYVIPEPEVSVVSRTEDDEFLLLASDGLWDVMANQEATNLTARCFKRARDKGASRSAAVRIAAAVLTKAAIDRGSKDNVTVVIVDVKPPAASEVPAAAQASAGTGDVLAPLARPARVAVAPSLPCCAEEPASGECAACGEVAGVVQCAS